MKSKFLKKRLSVMLVGTAVFSLAACSGGADTGEPAETLYDLSGKTVAPFNTSGGSGFSGSLDTIAEMEPEAEITEGLSLGDGEAEDCADVVEEWLANIGMTEEADS